MITSTRKERGFHCTGQVLATIVTLQTVNISLVKKIETTSDGSPLMPHPTRSVLTSEEKFPGHHAKRILKVRPRRRPGSGVEFPNASSLMSRGPFGHCTLPCFVGLGLLKDFL